MARVMKDSGISWIGEVPTDWKTIKFKFLHEGLNTGEGIDKEYWTNDESNIVFYTAGLEPIRTNYKDFPNWKYTKNTDLLLARNGTPYVYSPDEGACYTDHIIRAAVMESVNRTFVQYCLSQSIKSVVVEGVSLPTWSASLWNEQVIPWPSANVQRRIANFLDAECARIDAIIEQTRATVEEYKKLKQSIITQAVTKGIRPNRPMKDSGIEWIGEIPADWEISNLGAISENLRNGYVGPTKDLFYDEGIPYIQSLHIKDGRIDFSRHEYYVSEDWANAHPKIKTDDLLIVQTGDIGNVGLVPKEYNLCNCHALIIATLKKETVFPEFITFFLRSHVGRELLLFYKTGALLPHLNSGKIKFASICVPKLSEQKEIVDWLNAEEAKIDALICGKETFISELESYKKSLIYEYVTGKKEAPL